jgi:ppGpp synthetase/RelA/SpoT-type nucleotidyltranferase
VSSVEQARQQWVAERPKYDAFGKVLEQRLKESLKSVGVWFDVGSRAKTVDSLVKKLLTKRNYTFDTLPDKVGVRVIIRYRSDVEKVIAKVRKLFDSDEPENKEQTLGTDRVGYLSVHLDHVQLRDNDSETPLYPRDVFWAELQVRTLAQHLWSEMSHDTVYKNDEMVANLPLDTRRRVALMAGQIEVADREFDRLNMELSSRAIVFLLQVLERHYYTVSSKTPNLELSIKVLHTLTPLMTTDVSAFANRLNEFLTAKQSVIEQVYSDAREQGPEDDKTPAFLFQPEILLIYNLLASRRDETRELWNQSYPERELERIANSFGLSLD